MWLRSLHLVLFPYYHNNHLTTSYGHHCSSVFYLWICYVVIRFCSVLLLPVHIHLHVYLLSMFTVDPSSMETEKCRSFIQEQAISLLLDMVTIVTRRCTKLLTSHSRVTRSQLLSHDVVLLLPIVKLVSDWMTCHLHLWNPAPCPRDPTLG